MDKNEFHLTSSEKEQVLQLISLIDHNYLKIKTELSSFISCCIYDFDDILELPDFELLADSELSAFYKFLKSIDFSICIQQSKAAIEK